MKILVKPDPKWSKSNSIVSLETWAWKTKEIIRCRNTWYITLANKLRFRCSSVMRPPRWRWIQWLIRAKTSWSTSIVCCKTGINNSCAYNKKMTSLVNYFAKNKYAYTTSTRLNRLKSVPSSVNLAHGAKSAGKVILEFKSTLTSPSIQRSNPSMKV